MKVDIKRALMWLVGLASLSSCGRLDAIPYEPAQTPDSWLKIQPYVSIRIASQDIILVQPSSTLLVYLLGLVAIGVGFYFWRVRGEHRSRMWWGIALALWGLGALFAGTSYQAFSYEIKCAGRAFCAWTSWWEVAYLVLSLASIDAMLVAGAYSCTAGRWRRWMSRYAFGHASLYLGLVLAGALIPVKFLISFELLLAFAAPQILILFALNTLRYYRLRDRMDLALLGTWLWLGITLLAYFLYLVLDITQQLWSEGVWFSENDVLHIGLILWMGYIGLVLAKRVADAPEPALALTQEAAT
jgi:hypothetical protein